MRLTSKRRLLVESDKVAAGNRDMKAVVRLPWLFAIPAILLVSQALSMSAQPAPTPLQGGVQYDDYDEITRGKLIGEDNRHDARVVQLDDNDRSEDLVHNRKIASIEKDSEPPDMKELSKAHEDDRHESAKKANQRSREFELKHHLDIIAEILAHTIRLNGHTPSQSNNSNNPGPQPTPNNNLPAPPGPGPQIPPSFRSIFSPGPQPTPNNNLPAPPGPGPQIPPSFRSIFSPSPQPTPNNNSPASPSPAPNPRFQAVLQQVQRLNDAIGSVPGLPEALQNWAKSISNERDKVVDHWDLTKPNRGAVLIVESVAQEATARALPATVGAVKGWLASLKPGAPITGPAADAAYNAVVRDAEEFAANNSAPDQVAKALSKQEVHDIGVQWGRQLAIHEDNLVPVQWTNPFANRGAFGQGFDDIMQNQFGEYVIVEYKGGVARLANGQMFDDWVWKNIQRLQQPNIPPETRALANELADAFKNGRLYGVTYSTKIVDGVPQPTAWVKRTFYIFRTEFQKLARTQQQAFAEDVVP